MCRLMAYIGQPALLADIVLWPDRSIIKQSYDARERRRDPTLPNHVGFGNLNADGFGIGWFNPDDRREADPSPCVFTSITPAWNNENLSRLACKVTSPLVFAHVRAAYPGMPVSEQNCHPFAFSRYLWMHNGVLGGFTAIKRSLLAELSDAVYNAIQSFHSDSSVSFAVFLNHLPDLHAQQPPDVLMKAMQDTLATISRIQQKHNVEAMSMMNFIVSDGATLIATRYVWPETESAATLYYAEGASFKRETEVGAAEPEGAWLDDTTKLRGSSILKEASYTLTYGERGSSVAFVASEPITGSTSDWVAVPKNTGLIITREKAGYLNIMHTPLRPRATCSCDQACEVYRCLEAIGRGLHEKSRAWLPKRSDSRTESQVGFTSPGWPRAPSRRESGCDNMPTTSPQQRDGSLSAREGRDVCAGSPPSFRDGSGTSRDIASLWASGGSGSWRVPEVLHGQEQHRLTGHGAPVISLLLDQDAGRLFSGGADCLVKVWSLETLQCIHTISGIRKPVQQLYVRTNKLYTVSGRKLRIWDLATYNCVYCIKTSLESGSVCSMWVSPLLTVYVGTQDTVVRAFRIDVTKFSPAFHNYEDKDLEVTEPNAVTDPIRGHAAVVNALVGTGRYVCSAGGDGTVRLWDAETLAFVNVLRGHRGSVLSVLALGNLLLSGARDNTIRVWDMEADGMCRKTLQGHKDDVVQLSAIRVRRATSSYWGGEACSPARFSQQLACTLVASASADGTIRIWSTNWTCIRIFTAAEPAGVSHPSPVQVPTALAVAISQSHVIGGYGDGTIRLWRSDDLYTALASCDSNGLGGDRTLENLLDGLEDDDEEEGMAPPLDLGQDRSNSSLDDGVFVMEGAPGIPSASCVPRVASASSVHTEATDASDDGEVVAKVSGRYSLDIPSSSCVGSLPSRGSCMKHTHSSSWSCLSQLARHAALMSRTRSCPRGSPRARACPPQVLLPSTEAIEGEMEACLREFVRIKTVSLDNKHREECFRGAKYLARLLESLGADIKLVRPSEDRNPLVLGRLGSAPDRPTVTFYGHYDVQPAQEPDWQSKPFELLAQDGYFVGRGVSDNKGPILAFVFAVKELMDRLALSEDDSPRTLPVNIAFIFEGEEENGSVGFAEAVQQNLHWFTGTKLVVMSNTQWVGENVPCLTYGMRGMVSLSVEVSGPARDLHSGNEGGVFNEPLLDLTKVLGTLVDSNARILVPGFYDGIEPRLLDHTWASLQDSEEYTLEGYQAALGLPALTCPSSKRELLRARWCQPSLSLVDVRPSYVHTEQRYHRFGPTRFSVIPKSAVGKISVRYVAHQNPETLVQRFKDFLDAEFAKLGSRNKLTVHVESIGSSWEGDPEATHFKIAEQAIQREWGMKPLYVREGGTMPVASYIEKALGAPAIMIPLGQASDNCHLANERMRRLNLLRGKNVIRNLLQEVGRQGNAGLAQRPGAAASWARACEQSGATSAESQSSSSVPWAIGCPAASEPAEPAPAMHHAQPQPPATGSRQEQASGESPPPPASASSRQVPAGSRDAPSDPSPFLAPCTNWTETQVPVAVLPLLPCQAPGGLRLPAAAPLQVPVQLPLQRHSATAV